MPLKVIRRTRSRSAALSSSLTDQSSAYDGALNLIAATLQKRKPSRSKRGSSAKDGTASVAARDPSPRL
jgi:hypothetical protein